MKLTNRMTKNSLGGLLVTLLILAFTCEAAAQTCSPARLGRYNTPGSAEGVFVSGTTAYVADWGIGLQIIDVSDPTDPALVGSHDTPGNAWGVFVSGTTAYVADSHSGLQIIDVSGALCIALDIKPGSCPNPLNVKSKGVLPVAILGTDSFYVNDIDLGNVYLEGIPPLRSSFMDVATPFSNGGDDTCLNCSEEGPDGKLDLVLKFDKQAVVEALWEVSNGDCVELTLYGELLDPPGFTIAGSDHVLIIKKGKP